VGASPQIPGLNGGPRDIIRMGPGRSNRNYDAKTGMFELRDLLPGAYEVTAAVQDPPSNVARGAPNGPNGQRPGQSTGTTTVVIPESDVDGASITVVLLANISGRVRVDGQLQAPMTT